MSWWTDLTSNVSDAFTQEDTFLGGIGDFARSNLGGTLINLGAKELGLLEPNIPVVGYQGGIPEYQAVRERVPMPADPNRRPGSGGRRYFSDVVYADRPERQPMSVAQAQQQARTQVQGLAALNQPPKMSGGGRYLDGATDGMADVVPARISGGQEARLSDGEFVIPADVVSHLGNGNSDAGAKQLHAMMTRVRKERTGNPKQGKQIKAQKMLPT
tara:strand:- start:5125 stop:5769 length:645 start_codon:yes stop_codon:yes gene_type:complete